MGHIIWPKSHSCTPEYVGTIFRIKRYLKRFGHVMVFQHRRVVVEQRKVVPRVTEEGVCPARVVDVVNGRRDQRGHDIELVEQVTAALCSQEICRCLNKVPIIARNTWLSLFELTNHNTNSSGTLDIPAL